MAEPYIGLTKVQYDSYIQQSKQITQLKADLAKFGGHTTHCRLVNHDGPKGVPYKCINDCGFTEAQERWE